MFQAFLIKAEARSDHTVCSSGLSRISSASSDSGGDNCIHPIVLLIQNFTATQYFQGSELFRNRFGKSANPTMSTMYDAISFEMTAALQIEEVSLLHRHKFRNAQSIQQLVGLARRSSGSFQRRYLCSRALQRGLCSRCRQYSV